MNWATLGLSLLGIAFSTFVVIVFQLEREFRMEQRLLRALDLDYSKHVKRGTETARALQHFTRTQTAASMDVLIAADCRASDRISAMDARVRILELNQFGATQSSPGVVS